MPGGMSRRGRGSTQTDESPVEGSCLRMSKSLFTVVVMWKLQQSVPETPRTSINSHTGASVRGLAFVGQDEDEGPRSKLDRPARATHQRDTAVISHVNTGIIAWPLQAFM